MKLKLMRHASNAVSRIGRLDVDGTFERYTCEDVERTGQPKVHGQTAIARGTYRVIVTRSERFQRDLPLVRRSRRSGLMPRRHTTLPCTAARTSGRRARSPASSGRIAGHGLC